MAYKCSRLDDQPVSLYEISKEQLVNDFINYKRYRKEESKPAVYVKEDFNFDEAFKFGGLEFLLQSAGIVETCHYLKGRNDNYLIQVSDFLKGMKKKSFTEVMQVTVSRSPYKKEYSIDFFSVAKPAIIYHGTKEYEKLQYSKFFES